MHLLFKIAITELAFDYFTLITIYMNYYQFDALDSIPKKVGALRFSLKRIFQIPFCSSKQMFRSDICPSIKCCSNSI